MKQLGYIEVEQTLNMKNHHYAAGDEVRRQLEGGAIGSELTGSLANAFMLWWDDKLTKLVREAGVNMELFERYVDDCTEIVEVIEKGWRYNKDTTQLEWTQEASEEDKDTEDDIRTAIVVRDIANSIHPMIVLEEDVPSKHTNMRLPILDLECWMDGPTVWYQHYEKEVATRRLIQERSALPMKVKRNVLVNECVRRMRNCRLELSWEIKANFLSDYMVRMRQAGYDEWFRTCVLKQAVARYEGMVNAHESGAMPLYRDKNWVTDTARRKEKKKKDWLNKGGYDTVVFVPATPGGELAHEWKKVLEDTTSPIKVRVEETGGRSMKSIFQKSNPMKKSGCREINCLVCSHERGQGGDCRKPNIGYQIQCEECTMEVVYIGETSKCAYQRGAEHKDAYRTRQTGSSLWKHAVNSHSSRMDVSYSMTVKKSFREALTRQCNEAVRIYRSEANIVLNSKTEWHGPATVRLMVEN